MVQPGISIPQSHEERKRTILHNIALTEGLVGFNGSEVAADPTQVGNFMLDHPVANQGFRVEASEERQLSFTFQNTTSTRKEFYLFSGYKQGNATLQAGQATDGDITPIGGAAGDIVCTSSESTFEELIAYLEGNPTVWTQVKLETTVTSQMSQVFKVQKISPFGDNKEVPIKPANAQGQNSQNLNILDYPIGIILGDRNAVKYSIVGNCTVTLTMSFGASLSSHEALEKLRSAALGIVGA